MKLALPVPFVQKKKRVWLTGVNTSIPEAIAKSYTNKHLLQIRIVRKKEYQR
jgi:hypothetical protein